MLRKKALFFKNFRFFFCRLNANISIVQLIKVYLMFKTVIFKCMENNGEVSNKTILKVV